MPQFLGLKLLSGKPGQPPGKNLPLQRRATDNPPTKRRIQKMYDRPVSFTNLLPWFEYSAASQCFLLNDGHSVGALFDVAAVGVEARTSDFMAEIRDKIQMAFNALPEELNNPWVVQLYLQDEPHLGGVLQAIKDYIHPRARASLMTETYLQALDAHLNDITRSGGLFTDTLVTGNPWRGQRRRIRMTLYRRSPDATAHNLYGVSRQTPEELLNDVASKLITSLASSGVKLQRVGGRALYEWMLRWLNPRPVFTDGDTEALLQVNPYPGDDHLPYGFDFSESLMQDIPYSDENTGLYWFDGLPHKVITVQSLRSIPEIGLFGAERQQGEHIYAAFDKMPEGTVMAMTLVIKAQDEVRNHLDQIQRSAVGDYPEAQLAADDARKAQMEMAKKNNLYPLQMAFYVRGEDELDIGQKINTLSSLLMANGLQPIMERDDLIPLDSYVRNLPMAYDVQHDKKEARRSRLVFSKHAANLAPVYGRSTGTGHPGLLFFNRGAEPLTFDPLNLYDRKKNGHALIIGPTGSGKSATLVYLVLQMLAIYRPRIFIIEAGNSFGLLGQYLKTQEVSVNQVTLTPNSDVSLPPFSESGKLLEQFKKERENLNVDAETLLEQQLEADLKPPDEELDLEEQEKRDLLGEMEIAARIMITGGDEKEDARLTRADRLLIRQAILQSARAVQARGRSQMLTEDVVDALRKLPDLTDKRKERAQEMADSMSLFCDGLAGHFFNRPGKKWPDVDVTITDMGILAREGYEDQLTVAYIGLMNHIHDLVERHQNDERPTIVITDEGHIITTNPLLSPYVIKIVKMWRKLGAWFWIATQNLQDFPDAAGKMLNMLEWWLCLVMPLDEVDQLARFKNLTGEQRGLLLAARKSPGQFVEGVVLTDHIASLFRNVPPPIALALAMTEKEEKAERHRVMKQHQCSEIAAVHLIAKSIAEKRRGG